jgi:hypothetical protein
MERPTAMAMAFAKASESVPKGDLGIGHHIKWKVWNTRAGVKTEHDVHLNTEQFTGPYRSKPAK